MNTPKWFVDYCAIKNKEWQETIKGKIIIFLDTKILINFRQCLQRKDTNAAYYEIYRKLKQLVQQGKVICPLIESVFFELLKRKNSEDVVLIFEIVNELSDSLMQVSIQRIAENEIRFFQSQTSPILVVNKIQSQHLTFPLCSDEKPSNIDINKRILDGFLSTNIADLFKLKIPEPELYYREYIGKLFQDLDNSIRSGEKGKYKNFQELEKFEFRSVVEIMYLRYKTDYGLKDDFIDSVLSCRNIVNYMPFLYNTASMYAWIRWCELNNLETNDIFDLIAFPCALGYADYFFAEKKYSNRIKQKPLELDRKNKTVVEWKERNIVQILESIAT